MQIQHSKAFSLIELIFVIALVGVLASIAIPRLQISQKACYAKLASKLTLLQQELSFFYTKITLNQSTPSQDDILAIIATHSLVESRCFFGISGANLIAKAFDESTSFSIEPSDFSVQPSFKCLFSNALCREILNRTKAK